VAGGAGAEPRVLRADVHDLRGVPAGADARMVDDRHGGGFRADRILGLFRRLPVRHLVVFRSPRRQADLPVVLLAFRRRRDRVRPVRPVVRAGALALWPRQPRPGRFVHAGDHAGGPGAAGGAARRRRRLGAGRHVGGIRRLHQPFPGDDCIFRLRGRVHRLRPRLGHRRGVRYGRSPPRSEPRRRPAGEDEPRRGADRPPLRAADRRLHGGTAGSCLACGPGRRRS